MKYILVRCWMCTCLCLCSPGLLFQALSVHLLLGLSAQLVELFCVPGGLEDLVLLDTGVDELDSSDADVDSGTEDSEDKGPVGKVSNLCSRGHVGSVCW